MSRPKRTHYEVLIVSPDASQDEIKKARTRQLEFYHPDRFDRDRKPNLFQLAEEETKLINIAYEVLSDSEKRDKYDEKMGLKACPVIIPDHVTFEEAEAGAQQHCVLMVDNVGSDYERLLINDEPSSQRPDSWLTITEYDDSRLPIRLVIEAKGYQENTDYSGFISVKMDNIEKRVACKLHTAEKPAEDEVLSSSGSTVRPSSYTSSWSQPAYISHAHTTRSPASHLISSTHTILRNNWGKILISVVFILASIIGISALRSSNKPSNTSRKDQGIVANDKVKSAGSLKEAPKISGLGNQVSLTGKFVFHGPPEAIYSVKADGSGFGQIAGNIDLGTYVDAVDISADGSVILIAKSFSKSISIIYADGRSANFAVPEAHIYRLSPDGTRIVFGINGSSEFGTGLYVSKLDGGNIQKIDDDACCTACWSPDGSQICFVKTIGLRNPLIVIVNLLDGSRKTMDIENPETAQKYSLSAVTDMDWSPTEYYSSLGEILISGSAAVDSNLSRMTALPESTGTNCRWSSDGRKIAYLDHNVIPDNYSIKIYDIETEKDYVFAENVLGPFGWSR